MRRLLLGLLLTISACSGADQPRDEVRVDASRPFVLTRNDASVIAGAHHHEGVVTTFDSTTAASVHESVVRVHGKTFIFRRDDAKGEFTVSGGGATLDIAEKLALADLQKRVQAVWVEDDAVGPKSPIPLHGAMLLGELLWLSELRSGMTVAYFIRPKRLVRPELIEPPGVEKTFDYGTEPFLNTGLYCVSQYDGSYIWAQTMPWDGEKNVREEQLAKVNATGGTDSACPGGLTNQGGNGCGNWECQGQCGVGCQDSWRNGRFTDCFEHDVCTDWHADSDCDRDKFFAASAYVDSYAGLCR